MMGVVRHSDPQNNSYGDLRQSLHFTSPLAVGKVRPRPDR
jgi:hypothetical protein